MRSPTTRPTWTMASRPNFCAIDEILERVHIFERFYREVDKQHPQASAKLKFNEALKCMLDHFVTGLIETTTERVRQAGIRTLEDVRNWPERLAVFAPEIDCERREAKEFLSEKLYYSPTLKPQKANAQQIVTELFDHWLAHPDELPRSYQEMAGTVIAPPHHLRLYRRHDRRFHPPAAPQTDRLRTVLSSRLFFSHPDEFTRSNRGMPSSLKLGLRSILVF